KTGEAERISYEYCYLDYLGARMFNSDRTQIRQDISDKWHDTKKMPDFERDIYWTQVKYYYKSIYRYLVRYKIPGVDIVTFNDTLFVAQNFEL
ncbi:MAG TPA: hypothetical protein PLF75_10415, partial [Bacteroidales bacterium]|nr:hypothetical protein [Bacteroidales bacterium]